MPKPSKGAGADVDQLGHDERRLLALERIARTLALMATKGEKQEGQVVLLSAIGYSPSETAEMINTTQGTVSQVLYVARKKRTKAKRR